MRHSYLHWASHTMAGPRAGCSSKQPEMAVLLSFLVSLSPHGMSPTNAGSPSGQTVPARSTSWLRSSSGRELGMSKALDITKGLATTLSFSRIPAAIGLNSATEPKEPNESWQEPMRAPVRGAWLGPALFCLSRSWDRGG